MSASLRACNLCGEEKRVHFLFKRSSYTIAKCENCGLVYLSNIPEKAKLDELYSATFFRSSSKFNTAENNPSWVNARKRVECALKTPEIGKQAWLDIGCATGDFLLAAKPYVAELFGTDVSDYALEQARARGLENLQLGDLASLAYPSERFDLVGMWDVLEHVTDPNAALRKVFGYLRPGGYLVLSTGDVDSLSSRLTGRFWHLMIPPFHTYFFSKKTITRYLQQAGFAEIEISYPSKVVPLDFMFVKTLRLISPRLGQRSAPFFQKLGLGRIRLPINLFDIMTVRARKPKA